MPDRYASRIQRSRKDDDIHVKFDIGEDIINHIRQIKGEDGVVSLEEISGVKRNLLEYGLKLPASIVNKLRLGAARVLYPDLTLEEGVEKFGEEHVTRYMNNSVGQVVIKMSIAPFMHAVDKNKVAKVFLERFVKRLRALSPEKGSYDVVFKGEDSARLVVDGIYSVPEFYLGMVIGGLKYFGYIPKAFIDKKAGKENHFEIFITWKKS